MYKPIRAYIFTAGLSIFTASCVQSNSSSQIIKTTDYEVGDCFEFKEQIKDFGVILLNKVDFPDGKEFNLFPIKLGFAQYDYYISQTKIN